MTNIIGRRFQARPDRASERNPTTGAIVSQAVVCADLIDLNGSFFGQSEAFCDNGSGTIIPCATVTEDATGAALQSNGTVSVGDGAVTAECGAGGHSSCPATRNFIHAEVIGAVPGSGNCQAWGVTGDLTDGDTFGDEIRMTANPSVAFAPSWDLGSGHLTGQACVA